MIKPTYARMPHAAYQRDWPRASATFQRMNPGRTNAIRIKRSSGAPKVVPSTIPVSMIAAPVAIPIHAARLLIGREAYTVDKLVKPLQYERRYT